MSADIWVAVIGAAGAALGGLIGVMASAKLTQYRIKKLEDAVQVHNRLIERVYILEGDMREVKHDIEDLRHAG